ncbi:pleckstrin isoform X1 [Hippocampus zosterae]|uniref:pleckstrin isoform X1 n=2 Tax=Hippocampus zosterae TaxID=109293 RepID=UPI00223E249D|nr:pleckstrin isoform X1 [Hippocampus zosterae]XP_051935988.1 pleckstrin isoform X1 [Hippocampus zosterae]
MQHLTFDELKSEMSSSSLLNYWTAVWVVLSEDGLEFYKKKTDHSPKGMIPLKGAAIISPCQDCGNRMLVFKITTHKKQEHFFQASHVEEREVWVKDIKRAVGCLQGGKRFARKSTRRSIRLPDTINLTELYTQLRDQDEGVKELKLEQENRIFNHCFTGSTVVEWLISKEKARNRPEALMLATGLLNEGFLQPAGDLSKEGAVSGEKSVFLDQTDALYYFADSGFFCEGYSSDEDTLVKGEFRGNIVKQGCLLKQGHKRKNWKVRKFILRSDPAYMHYYNPTKGDDPLGSIYLRGCVVTAVDFVPDAKRYDVDGNLFEIITSDETHYFLQAATAEERKEWIEAVQEVSKTGN